MKKKLLVAILLVLSSTLMHAVEDPCAGPTALLNLMNRPTNAGSPCVVPFKKIFTETGVQYQKLLDDNGNLLNLPNAAIRFGLGGKSEVLVLLPNYVHQYRPPIEGASATYISMKHQIGYNDKWIMAVEGYLNPLDGSAAFGTAGTDVTINAIISYAINKKMTLTGMLEGGTQTQPRLSGGGRYEFFTPDLVLSYIFKDKLELYAEVYGASKTAPDLGWGWNADFGVLYLLKKTVVLDLEAYKRISGELGGFEEFIGAGISFLLG